ncbi:hypothetical protein Fmac_029179 [Flemingia macrophylla]|uniref:Germin-like protein n=1 Tax=Flemingia macrophylla TaxID=520843 RepID=A0ABD1LB30_9FABA
MKVVYFLVAILALASSIASAYDPSPLQDFCVALNDTKNAVFVNGKVCKDPKLVKAEDFFRHVEAGNTSNPLGAQVTQVFVDQLPGLNTLGVSLARIDFAPKGLNPPHTHPRGTEVLIVLEGTLYVGFVTSNQDGNRLFTKVLNKGDVFVFPIGLIHFQLNVGYGNAVAIAGLSSQSPGTITIANALFKATPPISTEVLTKAFQVDKKTIDYLQKQFWPTFSFSSRPTSSPSAVAYCYRGVHDDDDGLRGRKRTAIVDVGVHEDIRGEGEPLRKGRVVRKKKSLHSLRELLEV